MNWILLSLTSAIFLGLYDIAKKAAVRDNAVPPVLFFNVLTAAVLWLPAVVLSAGYTSWQLPELFRVESISWQIHALLFAKSALVGCSWILALYALKNLPMSIAAPIRASSPFWTILIAVAFLNERPNVWQWVGVAIILISFYAFSMLGQREGIVFHRDRWVGFMILATLLGSCSALYDKFLLQKMNLGVATVQAWFSIYLVVVMLPLALRWRTKDRRKSPFEWRWSIPMIAVLLLSSDFLYFTAVQKPDALISIISPVRRTSLIIAFIAGILIYGEKNWKPKAACVAGLLAGAYVLSLSR